MESGASGRRTPLALCPRNPLETRCCDGFYCPPLGRSENRIWEEAAASWAARGLSRGWGLKANVQGQRKRSHKGAADVNDNGTDESRCEGRRDSERGGLGPFGPERNSGGHGHAGH